jgi:Domain of unknown function (DUF6475)
MLDEEFRSFNKIWKGVIETYGKEPSDMATTVAFSVLKRYDLHDIKRALTHHINDPDQGRFQPKPADIVRQLEGDPESRSLQAWTKVEKAIGSVGPYESVVFDEPEIMRAIQDMGGWIELCKINNDELPFKRNEFVTRYRGFLNGKLDTWPKKLIGIAEAGNSVTGHQKFIKSPRIIGNDEKAALVYQRGASEVKKSIRLDDYLKRIGQDKFKQLENKGD